MDGFKADALFAFEVLEHVIDTYQFIKDMFNKYHCKTLIFSTLTFENLIPSSDWWYYSFETGQHINFYQLRTLSQLAKSLDCNFYTLNPSLHIFTNKELSKLTCLLLFNKYLRRLYAHYIFWRSEEH